MAVLPLDRCVTATSTVPAEQFFGGRIASNIIRVTSVGIHSSAPITAVS
jgi:hypothetical protein